MAIPNFKTKDDYTAFIQGLIDIRAKYQALAKTEQNKIAQKQEVTTLITDALEAFKK